VNQSVLQFNLTKNTSMAGLWFVVECLFLLREKLA